MSKKQPFWMACDEAGNTGPHYCDPNQPVFAAAAYLVADSDAVACRDSVAQRLHQVNKARQSSLAELKGSLLLRSARGRSQAADLLEDLERSGATPLVCALDKHFSLGGRFVDDYLDYGDNPRVGSEYCTDLPFKEGRRNGHWRTWNRASQGHRKSDTITDSLR